MESVERQPKGNPHAACNSSQPEKISVYPFKRWISCVHFAICCIVSLLSVCLSNCSEITRKSCCVNARDTLLAVYQVLAVLLCLPGGGDLLARGVPNLDRGYLPWLWIPTLDRGVPTLANGRVPTLDWGYLHWMGGT